MEGTPAESLLRRDKRGSCVCSCVWRWQSPSDRSNCLQSGLKPRGWRLFLVPRVSEPATDTNTKPRAVRDNVCVVWRFLLWLTGKVRSPPWLAVCWGSTCASPPLWGKECRKAHRRQPPGQTLAWRPSCPPASLCYRLHLHCSNNSEEGAESLSAERSCWRLIQSGADQ